jgi:Mlc titration factor MtfA (ptsG expression regulator)
LRCGRSDRQAGLSSRHGKLKALVLLFAEKQFAGAHGLQVTDVMRVSIAPGLRRFELGIDWYAAGP